MISYQLKMVGSIDSGEWTPSVTVLDDFEVIFTEVGGSTKFEAALVDALTILFKCQQEFGTQLGLFST